MCRHILTGRTKRWPRRRIAPCICHLRICNNFSSSVPGDSYTHRHCVREGAAVVCCLSDTATALMGSHRRHLPPPPLYDEVSVERRQTKRGSRLITKKSQVSFHPSPREQTSATSAPGTATPQAVTIPGPVDIPDYDEVSFDPNEQPMRKGKV